MNQPIQSVVSRPMSLGLILGPLIALSMYWLLPTSIPPTARTTASVGVLMAVFWVTEAIPVAATALIPLALFPTLGVSEISSVCAPFAKPVVFLFLGGFMLAMAVERCGLHRRLALAILRLVGGSPRGLLAGFMGATAFLSMWISNTATTVMMVPIATSLITMFPQEQRESKDIARFERFLLLAIAYSASIGGIGTLVGTPPNALLIGFLQEQGIEIGFGRWMLFAIPLVLLFLAILWVFFGTRLQSSVRTLSISNELIDERYRELGPITRAEKTVFAVFVMTALLWILREPLAYWYWLVRLCPAVARLNDATIAIASAITLFLFPVNKAGEKALDWESAQRLPWGVLILFGGGLSLAASMNATGLNSALADQLRGFTALSPFVLTLVVTGIVIFMTELTSNLATIAGLLPVLFGLGTQLPSGPLPVVIAATVAASCAFMLPVATAPNAVVFSTERVSTASMMKNGLLLNLTGIVLITVMMQLFGQFVFGAS